MTQNYDTPLCVHCSDPLDDQGRDLITGEAFCGANPSTDEHETQEQRDEEDHARLMAGLLGIDLNDRYPRGDENGIIGAPPKEEPLPRCTCPYWQGYHNDDCPHYTELIQRNRT